MVYISVGFFALLLCLGTYFIWSNVRHIRLSNYLNQKGTQTSAVVVEAVLRTNRGKSHNDLRVTYQDQQDGVYQAEFYDTVLYDVGSTVRIYYDPSYPSRSALATDVEVSLPFYLGIMCGVILFAFGLYMLCTLK